MIEEIKKQLEAYRKEISDINKYLQKINSDREVLVPRSIALAGKIEALEKLISDEEAKSKAPNITETVSENK